MSVSSNYFYFGPGFLYDITKVFCVRTVIKNYPTWIPVNLCLRSRVVDRHLIHGG